MNTPLLALEELALDHGDRSVLSDLQFTIGRGRWVALLGANASGKTTLLRAIAGRHEPSRGTIRIEGRPLYPAPSWWGGLPGFALPPEELPPFLTVRQCLDIHAHAHGFATLPPDSTALSDLLGLDAHAETLVRHGSLGTRQKLAIVLAMMARPALLLLDEVFNGLDFASALRLRTYLRERVDRDGMTILLATHSLDVVLRCCDELLLLDSGRLVRHWVVADFEAAGGLSALEHALASATALR